MSSKSFFHSKKIKGSDELGIGDHIYSYRDMHSYSHHGIYVGNDRVIHYTRTKEENPSLSSMLSSLMSLSSPTLSPCEKCGFDPESRWGVVKTCLDCFGSGHGVYVFEYDISKLRFFFKRAGACSTGKCRYGQEEAVGRAEAMLDGGSGGFGEYDLATNNCECFAFYCKTGKRFSLQIAHRQALADIVIKGIKPRKVLNPFELTKTFVKLIVVPTIEAMEKEKMAHLEYTN